MEETLETSSGLKVIVMGASAGGIDALIQVMKELPARTPAAILIVQHSRSSQSPSRLAEVLARKANMRVCMAEEGMRIEKGLVCLAPPGKHLKVNDRILHLDLSNLVRHVRPSVDVLFTSAAKEFGANTIGVILTGNGKDGAQGCIAIKAQGGITIAQTPASSLFSQMPEAAIAAKAVDHVLPLEKIKDKLLELVGYQEESSFIEKEGTILSPFRKGGDDN